MEIEGLGAIPSPRRPVQPTDVTAELAEARAKVRQETPPGRWDAVLAEIGRLQLEQGMSPLAALHAIYARLASGWVPPIPR
jgi:hypothetical protein